MDCRETQTLLDAFHDGELRDDDRARVESHLRVCPECGRLLADLARADEAAGVPDPGPAYWDRFSERLADRLEREAEGPKTAVLRPKQGWIRQQFRYLVPAVAAAALVVAVVRYGGHSPVAPTSSLTPSVPVAEPSPADSAGRRTAQGEMEPAAPGKREDAAVSRRVPVESNRIVEAPAAQPPSIAREDLPAMEPEGQARLADVHRTEEKERASPDRAAAPAETYVPSPPPPSTHRSATAGSPPVTVADEPPSKAQEERKKMARAESEAMEPLAADRAESAYGMKVGRASSPCEKARTLYARELLKEAEAAQRECLEQDQSPPAQEKGLIFLAELLDRQARFADADAVLTEVHRQFPESLSLDLYRQQRPMVQKQQMPVPATR